MPIGIEHDPTQAPVGRVVGAHLIELEDGEVAVETEDEMFTGTIPAALYPISQIEAAKSELETSAPRRGCSGC